MVRKALAGLVCLCLLILPGGGGLAAQTPTGHHVLTYWEAKAAGWHVPPVPSETGIRVCTEDDYGPGFASAEEAEAALQAYEEQWGEDGGPKYCQEDPRTFLYMDLSRPSLFSAGP